MPSRPATHRPLGWAPPPPKRVDPHYSTSKWQTLRANIRSRDGGKCVLCGSSDGRMYCDHIIERRKGGTDDPSNLRLLCGRCHERRHAGR